MFRKHTLILIILILIFSCKSSKISNDKSVYALAFSDSLKIEYPKLKLENSFGVIFPKECSNAFKNNRFLDRFTPSKQEIREVEIEISKQFLEARRRFVYNQVYLNQEQVYGNQKINKQKEYSEWMKREIKLNKDVKNYHRQYIGFIENNQKNLMVNFLDLREDVEMINYITSYSISFGHSKANFKMEYNIETKRLNCIGWSHL